MSAARRRYNWVSLNPIRIRPQDLVLIRAGPFFFPFQLPFTVSFFSNASHLSIQWINSIVDWITPLSTSLQESKAHTRLVKCWRNFKVFQLSRPTQKEMTKGGEGKEAFTPFFEIWGLLSFLSNICFPFPPFWMSEWTKRKPPGQMATVNLNDPVLVSKNRVDWRSKGTTCYFRVNHCIFLGDLLITFAPICNAILSHCPILQA